MINRELELRLKELDDKMSYPSVTLLMPLSTDTDKEIENPDEVLKQLIRQAKSKLAQLPDCPDFQNINKKLNQLPVKLPPFNIYKGFAAFVSLNHEEIIPLDFSVEKRAYVGTNFELRDIFRLNAGLRSNEGEESQDEKLKRLILNRYFECKPYSKRTY